MIYLLLAICCSSSIALIFKYSETKGFNRYQVTSFNYITASLFSLLMIIRSKVPFFIKLDIPINALLNNFSGNITAEGSVVLAIALGIVTGVFYLSGFLLYQVSIKNCGASLSCMFNKMAIVLPMIISVVLFNEIPTPLKWAGILLTMLSIIIVNIDFQNKSKKSIKSSLIIMFIITGFSELSNKIFQRYALIEYKNHFLLVLFSTAFILSIVLLFINNKQKLNFKSAVCGIAVGIPNMLTSFFFIESLNHLEGTIAYPSFSAGSIILIMIASSIIYKERLKTNEKIALIITLAGLVFVSI